MTQAAHIPCSTIIYIARPVSVYTIRIPSREIISRRHFNLCAFVCLRSCAAIIMRIIRLCLRRVSHFHTKTHYFFKRRHSICSRTEPRCWEMLFDYIVQCTIILITIMLYWLICEQSAWYIIIIIIIIFYLKNNRSFKAGDYANYKPNVLYDCNIFIYENK